MDILKKSDNVVFSNIIRNLALVAITNMDNVALPEGKGHKSESQRSSVSVYFLSNEKVAIDVYIDIYVGVVVPDVVCELQERIKSTIESATKYVVETVNVHVLSVID